MNDSAPASLAASRRPLTESERRVVRARIRQLTAQGHRASRSALPIAGGVILGLWLWTIVASDVSWIVITTFWLIAGGAIALWVRRDVARAFGQVEGMAQGLESALRRNAADSYDVHATRFAVLEEIEDEGACYAFELDGNRLVFICGQEFYESAKFPCLDFSLVYILNEGDESVDMLINKRGARAAPARTIPAAVKRVLQVPDHLDVRVGSIDGLEDSLRAPFPPSV
jgi:hypothetical protein